MMNKIKIITTDEKEKEYWKEQVVEAEQVKDCMHVINVYPEMMGQKITGFGGAFTEASAYNYFLLGEKNKKAVIEGYFGEKGLRYNMGRIHIHSCDFAKGNYTYVEEGDQDLSTFSIQHDKKWMLPMIHDAQKKAGNLIFLASPWSPPAYMKTNGDMNHGGSLKSEYRRLWAQYIARFLKEYKKENVAVSYLTVQNEPMAVQTWDSCIYQAEEERDFVKEYLGPVLEEEGLENVKIFVWDHNKEEVYNRVRTIYEDEKASHYVSGAAVHWYTGDHFEALELVKEKYPDKEIFFTEGCVEYSRFSNSQEVWKAEMYAHDIMGNLKSGVGAILDWNLLLDEKGGPNHVGNFCAAPVMCKTEEDVVEWKLYYYYIGHFSRYIKPGARKIALTRYTDQVDAAAFLNPDGERVVVILNKSENEVQITLREEGWGTEYQVKAHTIATFVYK